MITLATVVATSAVFALYAYGIYGIIIEDNWFEVSSTRVSLLHLSPGILHSKGLWSAGFDHHLRSFAMLTTEVPPLSAMRCVKFLGATALFTAWYFVIFATWI